jgi:hypothetical protein
METMILLHQAGLFAHMLNPQHHMETMNLLHQARLCITRLAAEAIRLLLKSSKTMKFQLPLPPPFQIISGRSLAC